MPPAQASTTVIGAYFFAISILFYTAYAIFTVPWGALGLELTDDYHERTNVQAWKNVFQAVGGVGLGTMWWLALRLGDNEVEGVKYVGVIFGIWIAACAMLQVFRAGFLGVFGGSPQALGHKKHKMTQKRELRSDYLEGSLSYAKNNANTC